VRAIAVAGLVLAACGGETPSAPSPAPPLARPSGDWLEVDAATVMPHLRAHPAPFLLVNVWSTWCEPCIDEMPTIVRLARERERRGLGLVFVSVDPPQQRAAALDVLRGNGVALPGWIKTGSDDEFVRALHPSWSGALPATLLLDRERRVVRFFGEEVGEATLRAALDDLIGGES
jgi:thiol-disulfide isomerase/thioredoxin